MLAVFSSLRLGCRQFLHFKQPDKVLATSRFFSHQNDDSDSSDEDEDNKTSESSRKKADTLKKLNLLINSMIEKEFSTPPPQAALNLKLAQPKRRHKKGEKHEETKEKAEMKLTEEEKFEASLASAAHDVAGTLGGDVKQTESELLQKLLRRSADSESDVQEEAPPMTKSDVNLSEVIAGMKIEHERKDKALPSEGRAQQVRRILSQQGARSQLDMQQQREKESQRQQFAAERVDLFGSPPLGIFKPSDKSQQQRYEGPVLETWQQLQERELKMAVTHPPSNIYEEMIQWTEQGKLWKFPINNEQGLEEEAKVFFADHVFLERHLEPWCPPRGPIRHFMELVCVGLSKNPYITVKDKREHLEWYRCYFEDKKALLVESGAIVEDTLPPQDVAQ